MLEIISNEIKSSLVPSVQKLVSTLTHQIESRIVKLESNVQSQMESMRREDTSLEAKIAQFESKLGELKSVQVQPGVTTANPSRNPYADIEQCAISQDWTRAFGIAVSVMNGTDFLTHLLRERYPSVEEFFNDYPIQDPHLALQVCINLSRELITSDKYIAYKLEMINEIILGVSADINLGAKFTELKDILSQLVAIVPPSTVANRLREVMKIVMATDRLMTPRSRSVASTPPSF